MDDNLTPEEREERDEAIDRAEAHANEEWMEAAYDAGVSLAHQSRYFISPEVVALIPSDVTTHEPRALGAVMRRLQRDGVIVPTDTFKQAASSARGHARPLRVWESMPLRAEAARVEGAA